MFSGFVGYKKVTFLRLQIKDYKLYIGIKCNRFGKSA